MPGDLTASYAEATIAWQTFFLGINVSNYTIDNIIAASEQGTEVCFRQGSPSYRCPSAVIRGERGWHSWSPECRIESSRLHDTDIR